MKYDDRLSLDSLLGDVPAEHLRVVHHPKETPLITGPLHVQTKGKGRVEIYEVLPGAQAAYNTFVAADASFRHPSSPSIMEVFYCHSGRVGWNMHSNISVYLGAGDMTVHSTVCCAESAMMFPLGYAEGISFSLDLETLAHHCPAALQQAKLDFPYLQKVFCGAKPVAVPACAELSAIFEPLYAVEPALRLPYLQLKVQELLLYLNHVPRNQRELTQYFSQQTELIKEIHALITEHLDHRFTIDELSKQYAINTSTLKAVFKTVYGLPIATYMKEYRIRQAMKLLQETNYSIAQIAEQVGYESQGKFTNAFKDVAKLLPSEYRKQFTVPTQNY